VALSEVVRRLAEEKLGKYCRERVPPHLKNEVRLGYKFRANTVTLFEERRPFGLPLEWVNIPVAQFRFDSKRKEWTLYCADRNSRWHEYLDTEPTPDLDRLLGEVDEDPTGIFWG